MNAALKLNLAGLAAVGLLVAGCTSVTIKATRDPHAVHRVERLFVVINHGDLSHESYSQQLAASLASLLSNPPPVIEISVVSPLELDEKIHDRQLQQFKPDAVLVIRLTTAVVSEYGGYPTLQYDASLFDPKTERRLWRGSVNSSGGTALMQRRLRETAEVIVKQLRKDGFL